MKKHHLITLAISSFLSINAFAENPGTAQKIDDIEKTVEHEVQLRYEGAEQNIQETKVKAKQAEQQYKEKSESKDAGTPENASQAVSTESSTGQSLPQ